MCGIVGTVHSSEKGPVDGEILHRMNSSLKHRGPDDEGSWVHGRVGLAMRRLSIIDLEDGHQPISNEEGNIWTVFNGEIYNFQELREELLQKGHHFKTRSDTEVIVHLYEDAGEDFVHRLRGMFAIALWDEQSQKLLLYRDRVGIKPLHYWFKNGTLVFASEIKAILEYPEVGRGLSLSALSDYLSFLYVPTPQTIYQEIRKLPAGHYLVYSKDQIRLHRYWDFHYQESSGIREKVWVERLKAALQESIQLHLVSDVPVGAFLSGGVDSSTVVAWMSALTTQPIKTYSMGFDDNQFNELPFAREVADHCRTDHHEKVVKVDAFRLLSKIVSGFDEPFADPSSIPTFLVSEFAREDLKVVLSGDGGDELFSGYLWTRKEAVLERYRRLPLSFKRALAAVFLSKDYRPQMETGRMNLIRRFLYDAGHPPAASFARRVMCFQPWMKERLLQPWVWQELKKENSLDLIFSLFGQKGGGTGMDKLLYWDSRVYLPDDLLTKVDRMSMMHALEVRVPLLDHKLIELAGSIPYSLKLKGWTTKYILKEAVRTMLPPRILKQRKQGFAIPIQRWFREELFDISKQLLLGEDSRSRRFFQSSYLQWILESHRNGSQRFGFQLYALVVFELWCRLGEGSRGRRELETYSLTEGG